MELHDKLINTCKHVNPNVRRAAAIALGNMGAKTAKSALAKLLADKQGVVKEAAIEALGKLNVTEVADHLVTLLGVEDGDLRKAVLQAVSRKGPSPESAPKKDAMTGKTIQQPGQEAPDTWRYKRMAGIVLSKFKPEIAVEPLLEALNNPNAPVRIASISGLGNLEAEPAVDRLITILKTDEDWEVRKAAAGALGKITSDKSMPALVEALEDTRFGVRLEAIIALNNYKVLDLLAPLSKVVASDNNMDVRRTAVIALGNLKSEYSLPTLGKALQDETWQVRKAALSAISGIKSSAVLPLLIDAINDPHDEVSHTAALLYPKVAVLLANEPQG